jgi:hypothetical protein
MNNPDHNTESLKTNFWVKILKFFDVDPGSGMEKNRIRDGKKSDPGWKKVGSGINILDPQDPQHSQLANSSSLITTCCNRLC